jgi:O-antigen/teichoic acid export membrane protein
LPESLTTSGFGFRLGLGPKLLRNLKARAGSEIIARVVRVLTVALAARWLGRADFGAWSSAFALGLILVQFADFGLQLHLAREVARAPQQAGNVLGRVLPAKLLLSAIVVAAFAVAGMAVRSSPRERAILWILGADLLLGSFGDLANYLLRGFQRLDCEARLNLLRACLGSALGLSAIRIGWGVLGFAAGGLAATALSLVVAAFWIHARFVPAGAWLRPRDGARILDALRPCAPIGLAILLSTLTFRLDVLVLAANRGGEAVGLYTAAHKVLEASLFLPAIFLSAVFPAFSELTRQGGAELRRLCRTSLLWLLALSAPFVLGAMALAGPGIRMLYGSEYLPAAGVLKILSPVFVLAFLNYALTHFLVGLNRQRQGAWLAALCLVVSAAGNLLLIPRYGMKAAAAMAVVSELVLFVLAFPLVRNGLREKPQ